MFEGRSIVGGNALVTSQNTARKPKRTLARVEARSFEAESRYSIGIDHSIRVGGPGLRTREPVPTAWLMRFRPAA
jgi:hypothetical protein